jgi:hypothetical protein
MEPAEGGSGGDRLRDLIAEDAPVEELWRQSFGLSRGSLWDDARRRVRQGLTSVEEAALALFDYRLPPLRGSGGMRPAAAELLRLYGE